MNKSIKKINVVEDSDDSDEEGEGGDDDLPPPIHDSIQEALKSQDDGNTGLAGKGPTPPPAQEGPSLMEEMMKEAEEERKKKMEIERRKEAKRAKKFGGGLKGGFFGSSKKKTNGSKKKKPAAAATNKPKKEEEEEVYELSPSGEMIPTLTANKSGSKKSPLVFDEVQAALGSDPAGLLNKNKSQWATQSLTDKIMKNPRLAIGMSNPRFLQAIDDMKKDPEGAKKKYKGMKEIEDFLKEFMAVMGQHFAELGEQEEKVKREQAPPPPPPMQGPGLGPLAKEAMERQAAREARGEVGWDDDAASKKKVDEVVNDRELSGILMDPEMQRVLQECALPGRMGKYMRDEKWGPKIKLLIDKGLIKVES
ncbi:hypothetical protein TrCOL_g3710 [Triparma columacea]|uniref:STI1/HOP DP domain-containing protein n=1 Tax=Triparma columacea TaxID=722753 RepID=A0A9W7L9K6_9STRA|nr:hypothetical protein TrCOL_g3710 [Triparma columacea]